MKRQESEGFTLVEIAIAAFLLGILGMAVSATAANSFRINAVVSQQGEVREAARAQMEDIVAWPDYATLTNQFDGTVFQVGALTGPQGVGDPPGTVTVDDTNPNLLDITVRVQWIGPMGTENFELRTMLTNTNP